MPMSPYLAGLRAEVGSRLLLLPSVTGCVFDASGRLLLARHGDVGLWATPGGGIDPDERPEECVVRELREELSVEVEVKGLIGVYGGPEFRTLYPNGHQVAYVISAFACVLAGGEPVPDGDEINDHAWAAEAELGTYRLTAWSPIVLPDAYAWWRHHLS
ncbi:NUDIX domain-containing protein [Nonomuraea longicatena]|uniref:Nudix hydrolase domain-containing protein n=1 Tax=Nonomuraea longicatena TaxID=83682 RepID=A0ABP3ZZN2_9ACTN